MKTHSPCAQLPLRRLQRFIYLGILVLFTAAPGKPGCGGSPKTIIGELDDYCHSSKVQCATGLDCVSYYDGGQMICSTPCQIDAHCPSNQVCNPAPQISDNVAASAPLVCQNHCTDLPGSGCGGDPDEPWTILKWEVAQVGGLYNLRGINSDGDAYLDATIEWPGDEILTMTFESPASCALTMNIAEAVVDQNTCDEEAAAVIGSVGLDLFTDMETVLADAKKDASSNWLTKGCPWVVGGMGVISAGYFAAGALWGAAAATTAGTGMVGAAAVGGTIVAIPAVAILGVTASGCWLNGKLQDPPLSECIADCSYGNTMCFDGCVDNELGAGELENAVLLPQCMFACEQDDNACLDSCSYLLL